MVRFGVLPYCNAAPLVHFIRVFCPSAGEIVRRPMEMLGELKAGRVDVGLMPTADFLREPGLKMIPGLGICADGPVESVRLQSWCPLEEIETIRFCPESRTSNALIRVLLWQSFGPAQTIRYIQGDGQADAEVIIGDTALCTKRADYCYDLSEMWNRQMDLPFVFAVWVYRDELTNLPAIRSILQRAKDKGLSRIPDLAGFHANRLNLEPAYLEHYLTDCLYYDVGPREMVGMKRFEELMATMETEGVGTAVLNSSDRGRQ